MYHANAWAIMGVIGRKFSTFITILMDSIPAKRLGGNLLVRGRDGFKSIKLLP